MSTNVGISSTVPTKHRWLFAGAILLIVGVSVGFRATELYSKSLWLDEFHTIDVAGAKTLIAVVDRLRPDFHAPAYFFIVHAWDAERHEEGRWISVAAGFLTILMGLAIARELRLSRAGQVMVVMGLACLPYQIQYTTELRPYSLLGLCALIAIWAAFSRRFRPRIRFLWFVLAATLGLYSHYLMSIVIVAIGAARLIAPPRHALPFRWLFLGGVVAVICFLPWIISVESWVYSDPTVMVRNEEPMAQALPASEPASVKWTDLVALPVRLISPLGGALGRDVAWFVRWASAALAIVGAFAFCVIGPSAIRSADSKRRRFAAVILSGVFCGILTVIACSWLWGRLPVQYFIISGWVWPFLLGGLFEIPWVAKRWRAILGVMLLLTGALGVSHVLGDPREDFKQGVAVASRLAMEGDTLCTAVLAQPAHYDNLTPFDVYATTVRPKSNDWVKRNPHRPCVVLTRSLRGSEADRLEVLSFHLGKNRRILRRITVDRHIDVYLLSPAVH